MIRETQPGLRRDRGHVAFHAVTRICVAARFGWLALRLVMTLAAFRVVRAVAPDQPGMRVVTGDAGERASALAEACGLAEINRLVPDVPRDIPVGLNAFGALRAVTLAAKKVEFLGRHSPGVGDRGDCLFSVM